MYPAPGVLELLGFVVPGGCRSTRSGTTPSFCSTVSSLRSLLLLLPLGSGIWGRFSSGMTSTGSSSSTGRTCSSSSATGLRLLCCRGVFPLHTIGCPRDSAVITVAMLNLFTFETEPKLPPPAAVAQETTVLSLRRGSRLLTWPLRLKRHGCGAVVCVEARFSSGVVNSSLRPPRTSETSLGTNSCPSLIIVGCFCKLRRRTVSERALGRQSSNE